jgi:UPF0755 protein
MAKGPVVRRILILGLVLLAGGAGFLVAALSPVQKRVPYTIDYVVLPGEGLGDIAANLHHLRLIRQPTAFEILARVRGQARKLQAGPYRGSSDEWAFTLLDRMVEGDFQDTSVTVPEGLWMAEVAEVVAPLVSGGVDSFLAAARDSVLLESLGVPASTAEGFLFPDTYRLIPMTPASSLVRQMIRTFQQVWKGDLAARAAEQGLDLLQVVTLASIVEAEAQVAAERPRIAAVYLNRIEKGLRLQADPTVHYALGQRLSRTLYDDLKVNSPYNTYVAEGLPPGPIGNPGREALEAVLWPSEPCDDLYFVALGDGTHLFAPDYPGHLRNRRLVRAGIRRGGPATVSEPRDDRNP